MRLGKREKLVVGAYAAPTLRGEAAKRKIKVVGRDGEVLREIDDLELRKKILEAQEIEFSTFPPNPKDQKVCAGSGGEPCPDKAPPPPFALQADHMRRRNGKPWRCLSCAARDRRGAAPRRATPCAGRLNAPCPQQRQAPAVALEPAAIKRRAGKPWRCRSCGMSVWHSMNSDLVSEAQNQRWAKTTPEQRKAVGQRLLTTQKRTKKGQRKDTT